MLRCIVARSPLATPFLPKLSFENEGYAFNREDRNYIRAIYSGLVRICEQNPMSGLLYTGHENVLTQE